MPVFPRPSGISEATLFLTTWVLSSGSRSTFTKNVYPLFPPHILWGLSFHTCFLLNALTENIAYKRFREVLCPKKSVTAKLAVTTYSTTESPSRVPSRTFVRFTIPLSLVRHSNGAKSGSALSKSIRCGCFWSQSSLRVRRPAF